MNCLISSNNIKYLIIAILNIGSGKSHHGTYPPSDPRLTLTLFDSSNAITTTYQPNSVYTLQISSTDAYTGYLFGAFDSVSKAEYGHLSYFTDDTVSKQISGVGCITHKNEVSLQTARVMWTSPSSIDSVVDLQSVVTFDKHSSLITLSLKGTNENISSTVTNDMPTVNNDIPTVTNEILNISTDDKHAEPFLANTGNLVIIIVLVGFLIVVAVIVAISFIKIAKVKNTLDIKETKNIDNTPGTNAIV